MGISGEPGADRGVLLFENLNRVPGFFAASTTRGGGRSEGPFASLNLGLHVGDDPDRVRRNRGLLWERLGLEGFPAVCLQQVHGTRVLRAGQAQAWAGWEEHSGGLPDCDGAVTDFPGLFLTVGAADCLALVLADPERRALGVAHAGWRGALAGVGPKLVESMAREFGSRPSGLLAGLSPCLGPCCLELASPQHRDFSAAFGGLGEFSTPLVDGHFRLDLWKLLEIQLVGAGLAPGSIEAQRRCTACHPGLFFSHRRDKGSSGRMWTLAGFRGGREAPAK